MPCGVILFRAHVDDHALIAVDQRGQLASAQAGAALAHFVSNQQAQQNDEGTGDQIVVSGEFKQVSNHQ